MMRMRNFLKVLPLITFVVFLIVCFQSITQAQECPVIPNGLPQVTGIDCPFSLVGGVPPGRAAYIYGVLVFPVGGQLIVVPDPVVVQFQGPNPLFDQYIYFGSTENMAPFAGNYIWWWFPANNPWSNRYPQGITFASTWCPLQWQSCCGGTLCPTAIPVAGKSSLYGVGSLKLPNAPGAWKYNITIADQSGNILLAVDPTLIITDDPSMTPSPPHILYPPPIGYNTPWFIITVISLMLAGGYLILRKRRKIGLRQR